MYLYLLLFSQRKGACFSLREMGKAEVLLFPLFAEKEMRGVSEKRRGHHTLLSWQS